MRVARFRMGSELLRELLHLPEDAKILDLRTDAFDRAGGRCDLEIKVESESLADVPEGFSIPVIHPFFQIIDGNPVLQKWT